MKFIAYKHRYSWAKLSLLQKAEFVRRCTTGEFGYVGEIQDGIIMDLIPFGVRVAEDGRLVLILGTEGTAPPKDKRGKARWQRIHVEHSGEFYCHPRIVVQTEAPL